MTIVHSPSPGWSRRPARPASHWVCAMMGLASLWWQAAGLAAPGDLDPSFGAISTTAKALVVQVDGRVVVGGPTLKRLLPNGVSDTGFSVNLGPVTPPPRVSCVAVQSDQNLLIGGTFTSLGGVIRHGLIRLRPDGQVDSSFIAQAGGSQWEVHSIDVAPDGSLLVGGTFETINDVVLPGLARLASDGAVDPGFVPAVSGAHVAVHALARQENGQVLVSRSYRTPELQTQFEVKRLNSDGSADHSFVCHLDAAADTIVVQDDRAILVGGSFRGVNGIARPYLARLAPDGTLDTTFTPEVTEAVGSLALQADGTLVVETTMETPMGALAGLHWIEAGGSRAGPFRPRTSLAPNLMLQHDGRLVAVGTAAPVRFLNTPALQSLEVLGVGRVRWFRGGSAPATQQTTVEVSQDGGQTYGPPVSGARVQGGWEFAGLGDVTDRRLRFRARISGGARNGSSALADWTTVVGVNRPVPVVHQPAGTPVSPVDGRRFSETDVGGSANLTFTLLNTGTADLQLDGMVVDGPAGTPFVITSPVPGMLPGPYESATFVVSFRPKSGGDFTANLVFFSPDPGLGSFTIPLHGRGRSRTPSTDSSLSSLTIENGAMTPAFDPSVLSYSAALPHHNDSLQVTAGRASIVGSITVAGVPLTFNSSWTAKVPLEIGVNQIPIIVTAESGSQTTYVLTITRASQPGMGDIDAAFDLPQNASVSSAVPLPGGQILVRGSFFDPEAGGYFLSCLWLNADGSLFRALPFSVVPSSLSYAGAAVQRDGRIVLAGIEPNAAPGRHRFLHRFFPDGTPDPSFVPPLVTINSVRPTAITFLRDDAILIAGGFEDMGDESRSSLARLRPDGTLDASFEAVILGPAGNNSINSLVVQSDGKIIIGGSFRTVNGVERARLARLHEDGRLDETFRPKVTSGSAVTAMLFQPDGKLVVAGEFSLVQGTGSTEVQRLGLARFGSDGSLDTGFNPSVMRGDSAGRVNSLALDTLGRLTLAGWFSRVQGQPRKNLARVLPDGSVDPAFAPETDSEVCCLVPEAGGTLLVVASDIWGIPTGGLVRLRNDPAMDQLTVTGGGRVDWVRGGSAPEVDNVQVEASNSQGGGFVPVGVATRSANGWTWSGGTLPPGGQVRTRASVRVGFGGGSMTRIGSIAPIGRPPSPALAFALDGVPVVSGAELGFPGAAGLPVEINLQVRNAGETLISPVTVTIDGPDADEFSVFRPLPSLAAGAESELGVRFSPVGVGSRSARLRLTSPGLPPIEFALKANAVLSSDASLASLSVVDLLVEPAYSPAISEYTSEAPSSAGEVRLIAPPNHPHGRLRVDGGDVDDPAAGTAIPLTSELTSVVLEVTAQDGVTKSIYRLLVRRRPHPFPGDVDPAFVADSAPTGFWKGVPLPDGGVLIQERIFPPAVIRLRRLEPDGRADPGFLPYEVPSNFLSPLAVTVLPDGEVLVGVTRNQNGSAPPLLVRLQKNGVPDPGFGLRPGIPVLPARLQCMAVQPDGAILLGGAFNNIGGIARTSIARLSPDGVLDTSFAPVLAGSSTLNAPVVSCIAVQADGRILIGGSFNRVEGVNRQFIARLERDGRLDPGFQPAVTSAPSAILFDSANRILVFPDFDSIHLNQHTRFSQDGTKEFEFRIPSSSIVGVVPQVDGRLVLGGPSSPFNGFQPSDLFRTDANRLVDLTMELWLPEEESLSQLAGFPDGRLMAVSFVNINGIQNRRLFRAMNGISTDSLRAVDSGRIRWERRGNAPEVHFVTFALSTDGGTTFSDLGRASRIENGWELTGLALPPAGHIRAHGRYVSGPGNRDSSLVESITAYTLAFGPRDAWRQRHFGTAENAGRGADWEDPDEDGLINFVEFAGGSDPNRASGPPLQPPSGGSATELQLSFVRSREAMESGLVWTVEWNDTLSDAVPWSSAGVEYSVVAESADSQQVLTRVPGGSLGRRFARLRIASPPAPGG